MKSKQRDRINSQFTVGDIKVRPSHTKGSQDNSVDPEVADFKVELSIIPEKTRN